MRTHSFGVAGLTCLAVVLYTSAALAQTDLAGNWGQQDFQDYQTRFPGPPFGQYLGIPLNDNARTSALSYSPDTPAQYHHECESYPITYMLVGPWGFRIWPALNPTTGAVVAWYISGAADRVGTAIWVDGRPQPDPQALHTAGGFTTGSWQGDTLVTTTTHIVDGLLTRNGIPSSNQESVTMYITRHGGLLTVTGIIQDPVYLSEPYILSRTWKSMLSGSDGVTVQPMYCMPEVEDPALSDGYHVVTLLPGKNPFIATTAKTYHIPLDADMGGAKTMYPEYQKKLQQDGYTPPTECPHDCCGWQAEGLAASFRLLGPLHCGDNEL